MRAIAMDLEALEKQKKELEQIGIDLSSRLADFESKQGQDISEEKKADDAQVLSTRTTSVV